MRGLSLRILTTIRKWVLGFRLLSLIWNQGEVGVSKANKIQSLIGLAVLVLGTMVYACVEALLQG